MMEKRWIGPAAGVLGVLLTILAVGMQGSDAPDFIDDKDKIAEFYADDPGKLIGSGLIDMIATLLILVFAAGLFSRLREAGATRMGSAAALAGAVGMAAMFHLYDVVNVAAAFRADEDGAINPDAAAALSDVGFIALGVAGATFAALWVAATAVAGLRTGALPSWLCWVSLVLALGLLIGPIAYLFLIGLLVWIVVVSVVLWRGSARPEPVAPAA